MIAEAYKVFTLHGKRADLYFWRSHDQLEVDLLLPLGGRLQPVEIKLTATPTRPCPPAGSEDRDGPSPCDPTGRDRDWSLGSGM